MRILLVKTFRRFQRRERISDAALSDAISRAEKGLVDASLGGGLVKQRVARSGKGKSSGYRTIIAYRSGQRAVFLLGFAKSEQGNIDDDELADLKRIGAGLLGRTDREIDATVAEENCGRSRVATKPRAKIKPTAGLKGKARVRSEISEIAQDLADARLMSRDEADKITLRMLGPDALPGASQVTPKDIVAIREREKMSQAVFARLLDVTTGTLSKWERGEIEPRGPARRLLLVIKAQGADALLKVARS